MPKAGDLQVYDGTAWASVSGAIVGVDPALTGKFSYVVVDPETTGMPPDLGPIEPEDRTWDELLEVLLCPECDFELGAQACSPTHAFLADNPMQHRLLRPLLDLYLKQIRATDKVCSLCGIPLATGRCVHNDVREDQVTMSREKWLKIVDDLGALHGLRDRVDDLVEDRAGWAEDAVEKVATLPPWNGKLHPEFLADLRAEFRRTA